MFKRELKVFLLRFAIIGLVILNTAYAQVREDVYDKINRNMEIFGDVYKEILFNYVDKINADKFFEAGINGMLGTLDPYTVYYSENDRESLDLITTGKYGGIGISVTYRDSLIVITDIMNGYEASRKGLRNGDIIRKIDGIDISGIQPENVKKKVRGEVGSKIVLTIERDNELTDFEMTRQEIIIKDISYFGFVKGTDKNIAYIKLDRFGNNSDKEFENCLRTLKAEKEINGLIIDLRNNGGGYLNASVGILNNLVEKNSLLVTTKGYKKDSETKYFSKEEPLIPKSIPLAILINQGTASASEILAGAIQDLDRGVIIGVKSFGKGLVQNIKDLEFNSKVKITIARYFTPSGRWIQSKDYFLENKFGVFLNTETFKQKEFKTLNGRTVQANGGIMPDSEIKTDGESRIHFALLLKDMFFKYANDYLNRNPGIKVFSGSDNIFEDFKSFIYSKGFDYKSDAEKKLDDIKKIAKDKNFDDRLTSSFNTIEQEIRNQESMELADAKDEILRSIETEINKRIITEKEQIESTFNSDMQLQEAIKLMIDRERYTKILGIN
ncbi:MAG: S41 family peptidase [Ignavibacteria bacterium]|nr:S41 family peptidase [Ignavibacteria bacterium]